MDFSISDDQRSLQKLTREILTDHVTHDRLKTLESKSWSTFDRDLWSRLAEAGITGIAVPEEFGGAGLGFIELSLIAHEVGRTVAPVPAVWTLVTAYVLGKDAPASVASLLPGVASGETIITAGLEPGFGVKARKQGDGYVLDGEVGFVPFGGEADAIVIPATGDDGSSLAVVVPGGSAGVTVTELETTNRQPLASLGFDGVAVAADAVIIDAGELLTTLELHLEAALTNVSAGVCEAALKMTAEHTKTREQFGKPIGTFQAVAQRAADAYIDSTMVKLTAQQAAWRLSESWPAFEEVAVAKYWAGDGGMRVLHACQHLHGGLGVDLDYPLHRYFMWGKQSEFSLGTPTRQLLELGAHLVNTPV